MNIFYLDLCPRKSAEYMGDKHVVKMVLETAQILSTAHRVVDGEYWLDTSGKRSVKRWKHYDRDFEQNLYKATHINHPSVIWARESTQNYQWTRDHFNALCAEYTYRYSRKHKCEGLAEFLDQTPINIEHHSFRAPPMAMPDRYHIPHDVVQSYRNYYINEKRNMHKWTKRDGPDWLIGEASSFSI